MGWLFGQDWFKYWFDVELFGVVVFQFGFDDGVFDHLDVDVVAGDVLGWYDCLVQMKVLSVIEVVDFFGDCCKICL